MLKQDITMEWILIEVMFADWVKIVVQALHEGMAEILASTEYIKKYEKMPPSVLAFTRV